MKMRHVISPVFTIMMTIHTALLSADAMTPQEIAFRSFPSVVVINAQGKDGSLLAFGSGFFVGEDIIASNLHVVDGASTGSIRVVNSQTEYPILGYVAVDSLNDLVLLQVGKRQTPLSVADDSKVQVGDDVFAIGNPRGLEGTFSRGMISGKRSVKKRNILQITAAISPGSSGGPVLSVDGKVVGIAVAYIEDGQNLNFAVPSSCLNQLMAKLHPPLGLQTLGRGLPQSRLNPGDICDEIDVYLGLVPVRPGMPKNEALARLREYYTVMNGEGSIADVYTVSKRLANGKGGEMIGTLFCRNGKVLYIQRRFPAYISPQVVDFSKQLHSKLKAMTSVGRGVCVVQANSYVVNLPFVGNVNTYWVGLSFDNYKLTINTEEGKGNPPRNQVFLEEVFQ